MFQTMKEVGFFSIMTDPAGFHQILCSSAWHLAHQRGEENIEHLSHASAAIQSVNLRLADPIIGVSDAMIAVVLAFACHAVGLLHLSVHLSKLR
jgi:hypothetical protein